MARRIFRLKIIPETMKVREIRVIRVAYAAVLVPCQVTLAPVLRPRDVVAGLSPGRGRGRLPWLIRAAGAAWRGNREYRGTPGAWGAEPRGGLYLMRL